MRHEPTPVVRLNAAVATVEAGDPAHGLAMVDPAPRPGAAS